MISIHFFDQNNIVNERGNIYKVLFDKQFKFDGLILKQH